MVIHLKTKVEQFYGMPIKYGNQCKQLSIFILEQTGEYLSFQTLRRFFGFIDKNKKPTLHTLNILSKLCGYNHFEDFSAQIKKPKNENNIIEYVYSIASRKEEDLNYHYVCRNIANAMYLNMDLLDKNMKFLAASKVAQEYFFERFPFIDQLNNPIYRRALTLYHKAKNTNDSRVFVSTIIYLADYLNKGTPGKLPKINLNEIISLHPFLQARIIGTFLIGSSLQKSELLKLAFDTEKNQDAKLKSEYNFPFFNYLMADYLIICKMYKEAITMIELGQYDTNMKPEGWLETGYFETLDLMYCIALEANGEREKALKAFANINIDHFHFIFKKYYTIQYLKLKKKLKGNIEMNEQDLMNNLISETKYYNL
jgi:hypothetical protein